MEAEDMYSRFRNAIENVNVIIATYNDALMGDVQVQPEKGTVAFGSGLHGWGFTTDAWFMKRNVEELPLKISSGKNNWLVKMTCNLEMIL